MTAGSSLQLGPGLALDELERLTDIKRRLSAESEY